MTRRTERVNGLLQQVISELLRREVKDPRVSGIVTITEVDVSPDLRRAKVFVSVLGSDEEKAATLQALSAARGFLHRELRRRLTIRRVPELTFIQDESLAEGARILSLIEEAGEGRVQ